MVAEWVGRIYSLLFNAKVSTDRQDFLCVSVEAVGTVET